MVDWKKVVDKLEQWILSEEARGLSEVQLRDYLLRQGYSQKKVDSALIDARPKKPVSISTAFHPSLLKVFLTALVFILVIISFIVNSVYLPKFADAKLDQAKLYLDIRKMSNESEKLIMGLDADPLKVMDSLEEGDLNTKKIYTQMREDYLPPLRSLALGTVYFAYSRVYRLDPLFPDPCENVLGMGSNSCRYYIDESTYDEMQGVWTPMSAVEFPMRPYKKIRIGEMIFHTILLTLIVYILLSVIGLLLAYLRMAPKLVGFVVKLILLFVMVAFAFSIRFPAGFLIFMIMFLVGLSSFLHEKGRKILVWIVIGLSIILMVGGLILIQWQTKKSYDGLSSEFQPMKLGVVPCVNTRLLSEFEKKGISEPYKYEEWNVCDPRCTNVCVERCVDRWHATELRGQHPVCICGCLQKAYKSNVQ